MEEIMDKITKEMQFDFLDKPVILKKDGRYFKYIGETEKLILLSAIGMKDCKANEIDSILESTIKDYSINMSTGEVSITYKQSIEYVTCCIEL